MGRKKVNKDRKNISLDDLCDLVNDKYNLRPNEIGSIEWHSDTCENAIVLFIIKCAMIEKGVFIKYIQQVVIIGNIFERS